MHPRLTIENSAGDLLHVQLHPDRVRDALNSPLWFQFLVEELLYQTPLDGSGRFRSCVGSPQPERLVWGWQWPHGRWGRKKSKQRTGSMLPT